MYKTLESLKNDLKAIDAAITALQILNSRGILSGKNGEEIRSNIISLSINRARIVMAITASLNNLYSFS